MIGSRFTVVRRSMALPQLAALLLSLGLGFQASLCPPGMDMGMEMSMPGGDVSGTTGDQSMGHRAGLHCVFDGSTNEDGRATCPFAVGGIGPCGTTVPAAGVLVATPAPVLSSGFSLVSDPSGHTDPLTQVLLPPPRA